MRKKLKKITYSLLPVLILLLLVELIFRLLFTVKPEYITAPLPDEFRGLVQPNEELFWSLVPNSKAIEPNGAVVNINAQGCRGIDIGPKLLGTYRILSLGESTTFGAGVADDATYSAILEDRLNAYPNIGKTVEVLNCGVSAYSSFQGLQFLKNRGLDLQPDMVLLYFEINDYMPATLRQHGLDEANAYLTDSQLYNSQYNSLLRKIIHSSRFLTYLHYKYAAWKIEGLSAKDQPNPLGNIGIANPELIQGRLAKEKDGNMERAELQEYNLGQRVSEEERVAIMQQFKEVCDLHQIQLVVIHPAYRNSKPHRCVLTSFCDNRKVPLFEAYPHLIPDPGFPDQLFSDNMHPNEKGHQQLGAALADAIFAFVEIKAPNN